MDKGGFERRGNVGHFVRYAEIAATRLSEYVDFWMTFNEPEMYSTVPYLIGAHPPQKKNPFAAVRVAKNLIRAHNAAAPMIRMRTGKPVSMAYHLSDLQPTNFLAALTTSLEHYIANEYILRRTIKQCDYIGVNYYFHHHVELLGLRKHSRSGHDRTDLGWGIHPEGLERVLLNVKKYRKPVYITENGLADADDTRREKFIRDHLYHMHRAITAGVDVRGYLHWSLIDNFEWEKGFGPRFGLVEIDREDLLRRKVRYSATRYAEICRSNRMEYQTD
jgi:beta-glucosidase